MNRTLADRVASDDDPLRVLLQAARTWRVPPTVFLGVRTEHTDQWTLADSQYAMALEDYEAGYCPGGPHVLAETSKPEHADAYRPDPDKRIRCHRCTAQALVDEVLEKEPQPAGIIQPLVLDPDVVAQNLLPVPPLPPELQQAQS